MGAGEGLRIRLIDSKHNQAGLWQRIPHGCLQWPISVLCAAVSGAETVLEIDPN